MGLKDFTAEGFEEMIELAGAVLVHDGKEYDCVPDDDELSSALEEGGFLEERSFNVHVRKSDFPDANPKIDGLVQIEEDTWRILEVITSPGDPCIRLRCGTTKR